MTPPQNSYLALFSAILLNVAVPGCQSTMHTQTVPDATYQKALKATDPAQFDLPEPGSPEEAAMIRRVTDLFTDYSYANLEANVGDVYADQVYFRDAFKQFNRAGEIREYLLEGLAPLHRAEFVFNNVARSNGEFYLDWTMRLDFKKTPEGSWEESIGVTRMRFNSEGKVILHQDYWDPTDIVYRRIPIAKQLIAYVKRKL